MLESTTTPKQEQSTTCTNVPEQEAKQDYGRNLKKENELTVLNTLRSDNKIVLTAMLQNTIWGILKIEITEDEAKQILTEITKL